MRDRVRSFKVRKGVRKRLKAIPNWQERLRAIVEEMVEPKDL
jgi:hypothetical protein